MRNLTTRFLHWRHRVFHQKRRAPLTCDACFELERERWH